MFLGLTFISWAFVQEKTIHYMTDNFIDTDIYIDEQWLGRTDYSESELEDVQSLQCTIQRTSHPIVSFNSQHSFFGSDYSAELQIITSNINEDFENAFRSLDPVNMFIDSGVQRVELCNAYITGINVCRLNEYDYSVTYFITTQSIKFIPN